MSYSDMAFSDYFDLVKKRVRSKSDEKLFCLLGEKEFTFSEKQILENEGHFRICQKQNLTPYKALVFLELESK